jgi:hypothetical protein
LRNYQERTVIIGVEKTGKSKYQTITDKETGEVIGENWITRSDKKPGRPKGKDAYFIKLYRSNLVDIVSKRKLDLNEAGLLFMLLPYIGWQTPYIINPHTKNSMNASEIANKLKLDRSHCSGLLDRLVTKGILCKVNRGAGKPNHYMINVNISFYGKTIDDINHIDVFKNCAYEPKLEIKYTQTPNKDK